MRLGTSRSQSSGQREAKQAVARAALELIEPHLACDAVVGIGTGSTANCFIDALAAVRGKFDAAVSSSEASTVRLKACGIHVLDLNAAPAVAAYVDGADEVDPTNALIKGGGGALAREKVLAASAERFICIVDDSKCVGRLGAFPLPVEALPMARGLVARALAGLGGQPVHRQGAYTDNGNVILDVQGLEIADPDALERCMNNIVGTVANGLFAANRPDAVLVGTRTGVDQR